MPPFGALPHLMFRCSTKETSFVTTNSPHSHLPDPPSPTHDKQHEGFDTTERSR